MSTRSFDSVIAQTLEPFIERGEIAGAVTLAVSADGVVHHGAIGYADIAAKKAMELDTLFWIASSSKPIAATAAMILVDRGKLQLDDPVERYLPAFSPKIVTMPDGVHPQLNKPEPLITLRHLLSHTSGLPYNSPLEVPTLDRLPIAVRVEAFSLESLRYQPGSSMAYSDAGITTAARLVEVVSGKPYEEFLQHELLGPLGMSETTFWPTDAQLERLAKSYKLNVGTSELEETPLVLIGPPLSDRTCRFPVPGAGLFSTASDLGKFCQLYLNRGMVGGKRLLSESAIAELTSNQLVESALPGFEALFDPLRENKLNGYGLGWLTFHSGAFSHGGAYANNVRIDPGEGLGTVWLIQYASDTLGKTRASREAFEQTAAAEYMRRVRV